MIEDFFEVDQHLVEKLFIVFLDISRDPQVHPLKQLGVDLLLEFHQLRLQVRFIGDGLPVCTVSADHREVNGPI